MISKTKLFLIIAISVVLILYWNSPYLYPLKLIVVYLHEISHALGVIITGGRLENIQIFLNESGYVQAQGGNFFIIAIAGYIGSIFWGSLMLYASLTGKQSQIISVLISSLLFFFSLYPALHFHNPINTFPAVAGSITGLTLIITSFISERINRVILFFFGSLTSLYGVYDLNDFFSGRIMETDAGILASYYFQNPFLKNIVAYLLAIFISAVSIYIFVKIIQNSIKVHHETEDNPNKIIFNSEEEMEEFIKNNFQIKEKE